MISHLFRSVQLLMVTGGLALAGGCQMFGGGGANPPTPPTRVARAARPAIEEPTFLDPDAEHNQSPQDIAQRVRQLAQGSTQGSSAGSEMPNDVPNRSSEPDPTPVTVQPTLRPRQEESSEPQRTAVPRVPEGQPHDQQYVKSYSTPPVQTPAEPPPVAKAPSVTPAPDPAQAARARTLSAAANPQTPVGEPDNIPPDQDVPASQARAYLLPNANEPLEDRLHRQAHEHPHDPLAQLDWELCCTLKGDYAGGLPSVAMLPDRDRMLISSLIDGIRTFRGVLQSPGQPTFAEKIGPLLAMADQIRSQAELDLPVIEICESVERYGTYKTMDAMHLPAGGKSKFIVYCEVENFVPQLDARRMYLTRLSQQVELFSDSGSMVWSDQSKEVDDICRRQRRDFYVYDIVMLPPTLPPGRYVVKVTVTDLNAKKFTETATEIALVGAVENAKTPIPPRPSGPLFPFSGDHTAGAQYEPVTGQ